MDVPETANGGKSNGALFSGRAGDSIEQVVLCFDWCALEVLPNPSLTLKDKEGGQHMIAG